MIRRQIILILGACIALLHTGCVQYGTIGDGQVSPEEQQALERIVDIVTDIIEERQHEETAPVDPPVVDDPAEPVPEPVEPTPDPEPALTKEVLQYHGRYNGDRPTWYGAKNFNQYPSPVYLTVKGCLKRSEINHNGVRVEFNGYQGYILKQSDVSYRGLGVVGPESCKSTLATLEY